MVSRVFNYPVTGSLRRATPRYQRVAERLIEGIRSGRFAVGSTIPGEHRLVERYRVSRHTVREALRRLGDLGLIVRKRGIGTVVLARNPAINYVQRLVSSAELMRYPTSSRLEVLKVAPVLTRARLAERLGCELGVRWVQLSTIRRLSARCIVIGWSDIYILSEYAEVATQVGRSSAQVFELIEQRFGQRVDNVQVQITAGVVNVARATTLGVPSGSPSLQVLRRYSNALAQIFLITVAEHPAKRFTYELSLQRSAVADEWVSL